MVAMAMLNREEEMSRKMTIGSAFATVTAVISGQSAYDKKTGDVFSTKQAVSKKYAIKKKNISLITIPAHLPKWQSPRAFKGMKLNTNTAC